MKKEKNVVNNEHTFLELPLEKYDFYDDPEVIEYIANLEDYETLSKKELEELLSRKSDKKVMDRLIKTYMYLPIKYAAEMSNKTNLSNMDLISEGNLGLINAINNYSLSNGEFNRYLARYIKKSILKACLVGAKSSSMSYSTYETVVLIRQIKDQLQIEYSRENIYDEELLIEWLERRKIPTDGAYYRLTPKEQYEKELKKIYFKDCSELNCEMLSLDELDSEYVLGEDISFDLDKKIELEEIRNIFMACFNDDVLTQEEKYILMSLFGFIESKTTRELSEELNIKISNIYLIYKKALLKIKKSTYYKLCQFKDTDLVKKK